VYRLVFISVITIIYMKNKEQIISLLNDITIVYEVGIRLKDTETSSEKRAQIDILKWILE